MALTLHHFFPPSPLPQRNGVAKLNIFFKELNYKTNSESPSVTVWPALVRKPGISRGLGRVAVRGAEGHLEGPKGFVPWG